MKTLISSCLCIVLFLFYEIMEVSAQQSEMNLSKEMSILERQIEQDRRILSFTEGREKYLCLLEEKRKEIDELLAGKKRGNDNLSEEVNTLFYWSSYLSNYINKFKLLNQPRIKEVADSIRIAKRLPNALKANNIAFGILKRFDKVLRNEVIRNRNGGSAEEMWAKMDSVSTIIRALDGFGDRILIGGEGGDASAVRYEYTNW